MTTDHLCFHCTSFSHEANSPAEQVGHQQGIWDFLNRAESCSNCDRSLPIKISKQLIRGVIPWFSAHSERENTASLSLLRFPENPPHCAAPMLAAQHKQSSYIKPTVNTGSNTSLHPRRREQRQTVNAPHHFAYKSTVMETNKGRHTDLSILYDYSYIMGVKGTVHPKTKPGTRWNERKMSINRCFPLPLISSLL